MNDKKSTLFIHSSTSPDIDNFEWISMKHDSTNFTISIDAGNISINKKKNMWQELQDRLDENKKT